MADAMPALGPLTYFTCPHCGKRAQTDRTDVEWVDVGNGMGPQLFIACPPDYERHIDSRVACETCFKRAGERLLEGEPHPYSKHTHNAKLARINAAAKEQ